MVKLGSGKETAMNHECKCPSCKAVEEAVARVLTPPIRPSDWESESIGMPNDDGTAPTALAA